MKHRLNFRPQKPCLTLSIALAQIWGAKFIIHHEIAEMLMLICFGSSWPFAIFKSLRTKSASGKSIVFLSLILAGYAFGITYKLMNPPDTVIWLYVVNSTMISTEIILYFKYRKSTDCVVETKISEKICSSACLYH